MGDMQWQQELETERMLFELAIVQRIQRGLATNEDALYVARSFGLTTELTNEQPRKLAEA